LALTRPKRRGVGGWNSTHNSSEACGGGAAQKHLISKRKAGGHWWYSLRFGYSSKEEAWNAIRAGFLPAFDLAKSDRYAEIDTIEAIERGFAIQTKTL
jgi:5-methylcytosine-specific restriction enzyme B